MSKSTPRKGMPSVQLTAAEFKRRFLSQFVDPAFAPLAGELDAVADAAWSGYSEYRKSPNTRPAGPGYHDPKYELSVDWIAARAAVEEAQKRHDAKRGLSRVLLINASSRSEHTCPGEMSKSWRLMQIARDTIAARKGFTTEVIDLSNLASEYGRHIHPCKACFSTSPALCHWPCSCYPNYAIGQTQDWMNDIYPLWVEAHGVMIVTPVNWYQATSPLKLMIDRLVCADGGNPDPTLTQGKDAKLAKQIELAGWDYPRHLAGRLFAVVVHGDVEGAETLRRILSDWMCFMHMEPAGALAELDRYIGYLEPYATSHAALDKDEAVQEEVRNAARQLADAVTAKRAGKRQAGREAFSEPRQK